MEDLIIRAVAKSDTSLPTIEIGINKSGHAIFSLPPVGLPLPDQYSDSVEQGKQNRPLNSICTSQMSACLLLSLHQISAGLDLKSRLQHGVGGVSHFHLVSGSLDMKNHRGACPPSWH